MDESQLPALKPELDRFAPLFGRGENRAHASGVAHGLSSGRFVFAPRARRESTVSGRLCRAAHPGGGER